MRRAARPVLAGAIGLGALAASLAGCGGQSEEEELSDLLQSRYEWPSEQADCVVSQVYERFSEEQIETLRKAESAEDLPEELRQDLYVAVTPCASAGS